MHFISPFALSAHFISLRDPLVSSLASCAISFHPGNPSFLPFTYLISPLVHFTSPSSPLTLYLLLHELLLPRSTICTLSFPPLIFLLKSFAFLFSFRNPLYFTPSHFYLPPLCILFPPDAFYFLLNLCFLIMFCAFLISP